MKLIVEKKILEVKEQMSAMETEPMYYLKPAWQLLQAQLLILNEVISEQKISRAIAFHELATNEINALGQSTEYVNKELSLLIETFTKEERNAYLRVITKK